VERESKRLEFSVGAMIPELAGAGAKQRLSVLPEAAILAHYKGLFKSVFKTSIL
jgi:hypothetical protein